MINLEEIKTVLQRNIGIKEGDDVMVHCSYKSMGGVEGGPSVLIKALLECVGDEGTLLVPAFNFTSWSNEHYFDILETPSQMGVVTEIARGMESSKRTEHPFYSFSVFGKAQAQYLACAAASAMGENSVFELFYKRNGTIVSIGLDYNDSFTLIHQVETMNGVDYRRNKDFGGIYVDENRNVELRKYAMFVRANFKVQTKVNPALEYLFNRKVVKETFLGDASVKYCQAQPFYDELVPVVKSNPEYFHTLKSKK